MAMRILVIDTATPHLSIALFEQGEVIGHRHALIGRGHAEQLLPSIAALPDGGRADAIRVGCGPGSFTGQRIGLAAARALAFGWGADLKGFNSLSLIAADGRRRSAAAAVGVAVDGGHGEWLVADAHGGGAPITCHSAAPAAAAAMLSSHHVAGQRAGDLVDLRGWGEAVMAEADARCFVDLSPEEWISDPRPIYARAPDAKAASS